MSFLQLTDLSKFYGNACAVSAMNLAVEKGEFVSLLGPSGCGKTTTLQMVAGFVTVSSGRIALDGRDITHAKANTRGLGIVFQSYALFAHMTVADNVGFGLEMRKLPKAERRERTALALALVHLEQQAGRYPRELSGGQRQRVALARALVIEPAVLLLDEPLSNLDAKLREEMQFELRQIQRKVGTTTVMVTHDQSEAMSISDRVVVMQAGRATQIDHPQRVYEHPRTRFIATFVGKANLLPGTVGASAARTQVTVGPLTVEVAVQGPRFDPGAAVLLSVRPEKLQIVPVAQGRLDGAVCERFFLGSQWLYRVGSAVGELMVLAPNDGRNALHEGDRTGLDWPDHCMRLLPADDADLADGATEAAP
ncbi:ABC transporter ATP-binding protein [Verminephrobacter eiseniae]|uniref:ABC transporter related n=1 Tax=Verminephrobacter eiseniae (strain EF01-2) TaxID=391735 RepID=A1WFY3_VEREI|nr:ABC transporter ATP-binding protein [Verminephrobacter eiseniae]ABM56540.1 ABC transporter related [Verminephrobacter eiseniae EF01-2]MCW5286896.1 ABC transporter ATP-binding protein [Verminephrobacter eiseniae]MCW5305194.1 ABC transporter ATP-binding protein [Verminephrobacter eiseniae]MCW8182367.1 ABC transporter ATP-binding protein [Verminephrobacter eiseniae]MCW8192736.1 ABC transporter ATP-binding protein [Verminephrobacter eiseniae]